MGKSVNYQSQDGWHPKGALTTAQAALTTDKSLATVQALTATGISIITIPEGWPALMLRFRGVMADGDSNVINIYGMKGDDHYSLMATLTLTTGTQVYETGNRFVDTIVETVAFDWHSEVKVHSPAGVAMANNIGTVSLNTHGYDNLLIIATTLNSTSVIPEISRAA